jgi:hypothetical protein
MISVELGFLIIKINTVILMAIFIYGVKVKRLDKSEMIIMATMLVSIVTSQIIVQDSGFYTFYLSFASSCLAIVGTSIFLHVVLQEVNSKYTYFVYGLFLVKFLSHMLLHRVRTQIYTSDEPIMWLIQSHSALVFTCDFFIVVVLFLKVSKWKLRYTFSF